MKPLPWRPGIGPCYFCRREVAVAFREAWGRGNAVPPPDAGSMDATLHRERLDGRAKRQHELPTRIRELPDGTMIAAGDEAFTIVGGRAFRWSFAGYLPAASPEDAQLLTPPSTLKALAAGYRPVLHPSIGGGQ